jgi:hemerythrin-like metal-binding protein
VFLVFTPDLETKLPEVDAHHRALFDTINQLQATMKAGKLGGAEATLEFLGAHVTTHFAEEEQQMVQAGYPEARKHALEHQELVAKYVRFREAFAASAAKLTLTLEFTQFVMEWLNAHVRQSDGAMARWMRAQVEEPLRRR